MVFWQRCQRQNILHLVGEYELVQIWIEAVAVKPDYLKLSAATAYNHGKKKLEKRQPSLRVETRTRHLQTSKQKFYLLYRDIQYTHD
jgi:hypothetical protein